MKKRILYSLSVWFTLVLMVPVIGASQSAENLYNQARSKYQQFWTDEDAKAKRGNWLEIISSFEKVYRTYPNSSLVPKAYYMAGKLSYYCYKYHRNAADFERGVKNFKQLVRRYPNNSLADDSRYYLGELYLKAGQKKQAAYNYRLVVQKYPDGDMQRDARQRLEQMGLWPMPAWLLKYGSGASSASVAEPAQPQPLPSPSSPSNASPASPHIENTAITSGRVLVKEIKYYSSGTYTRVVIYCKDKVEYGDPTYIPPTPDAGINYPRMFIDIRDSRIAPGAGQPKIVNDGLLRRVRAGQNCPDVVRVVLDIDSIDPKKTRVIPMEENDGDFRIVIDVTAESRAEPAPLPETAVEEPIPEDRRVRKVVIDPGHGGKDPGAVGAKGLKEKDVVLKLSLKAAEILRKKTNIGVRLTRTTDKYLSLEERTAFANVVGADVFVSIHANAHPNRNARGIETYLLDTTNDKTAKRLAALENRVSIDTLDNFQKDPLLFKLFQKAKADESYELAQDIQKRMIGGLRGKYKNIFDHGVREAPFFVLMGATMPCVLIEVSFISNPVEEKRLRSEKYLDALAQSIAAGIADFAKRRNGGHATGI